MNKLCYLFLNTHEAYLDLGSTKPVPLKRGTVTRPAVRLLDTKAAHARNIIDYGQTSKWIRGRSLIAQSKDECTLGAWVFAEDPIDEVSQSCSNITGMIPIEWCMKGNSDSRPYRRHLHCWGVELAGNCPHWAFSDLSRSSQCVWHAVFDKTSRRSNVCVGICKGMLSLNLLTSL